MVAMEFIKNENTIHKVAAIATACAKTHKNLKIISNNKDDYEIPNYVHFFCPQIDPTLNKEQKLFLRLVFQYYNKAIIEDFKLKTNKRQSKSRTTKVLKVPKRMISKSKFQLKDLQITPKNDSLQRYISMELQNLSNLITLETKKERIKNGFVKTASPKQFQDLWSIRRFEPRIYYIAKELKLLFNIIDICNDDEQVPISGFALKNLKDWLVNMDSDPSLRDPYVSILQYLSHKCSLSCKFCLHKNDPIGFWTKSNYWEKTTEEVEIREKYFSPNGGKALFKTQDYSYFEVLDHPAIMETLQKLRRKTKNIIAFTTNGLQLSKDFVLCLKKLEPIYLVISLNSINPAVRRDVMGDGHPELSIKCLERLNEQKIPFSVSIVPWLENSFADLAETIHYADKNNAYLIRVNLDGYSKYFNCDQSDNYQKNIMSNWSTIVDFVRSMRSLIQTPIVFQPSMYEENLHEEATIEPVVNGLIKNSPASKAGLRYGDKIIQIDHFIIPFKTLARNIFKEYQRYNIRDFSLTISRGNEIKSIHISEKFFLSKGNSTYPFSSYTDKGKYPSNPFHPFGIVLQDSLNPMYLWDIEKIIRKHNAKNVLFLSSILMEPIFSKLVRETHYLNDLNINFYIDHPKNDNFLGGSIIVGDLLVVDDFIESINNHQKKIDLVILPSTPFGAWGRDISGKVIQEIERKTGIDIELIKCEMLNTI